MGDSSLLPAVVRWWRLLVVAAVLSGLLGVFIASRSTPEFESTVQLLTGPIHANFETLRAAGELSKTYAELAVTRPLLESVAQKVGLGGGADTLEPKVRASASSVSRLITVFVRDENPTIAARTASEIASALQELEHGDGDRADSTAVDALMRRDEVARLPPDVRESVRSAAEAVFPFGSPSTLSIVNPARVPTEPVGLPSVLIALLGALAGGTLALVVVILRTSLGNSIESPERLEQVASLRCLGALRPLGRRRFRRATSSDQIAESLVEDAYRLVAAETGLLRSGVPRRRVLVVGADGRSEAPGVAAGLAVAVAASDIPVALVEAGPKHGLASLLSDPMSRGRDTERSRPDPVSRREKRIARGALGETLNYLPTEPDKYLSTERDKRTEPVREVVASVVEAVGCGGGSAIVILAPPICDSTAALDWGGSVDACVLVAHRSRTPTGSVVQAARTLALAGLPVTGTVMSYGKAKTRLPDAGVAVLRPAQVDTT